MGERTSYPPGTFSWVDLATTDAAAAKAFYGGLFGWEGEDMPAGDAGTYTMLRKVGREVAGLYELEAQMREQGIPPHWTSYVTVADVDASATRAEELGGTVLAGPFDVMEAGRMASVRDPQGAVIALWQAGRHPGAGLVNEPGALCWNDLMTPDPRASQSFYAELFGWRIEETPGSGGYYWSIHNGDSANGGLLPLDGVPPAWNTYFATDDLDAAIATVTDAGGDVLMPPREVPAGRFGAVRDPQGAAFSLFEGQLDP
ncbi:MAG: VOC family protein [Thermoleophilaceae bacterium]|jgi:predicted enzyme related to lactoylglutathione lyase|nr:VOC family protein [Thermoleophilaceae bacterium]